MAITPPAESTCCRPNCDQPSTHQARIEVLPNASKYTGPPCTAVLGLTVCEKDRAWFVETASPLMRDVEALVRAAGKDVDPSRTRVVLDPIGQPFRPSPDQIDALQAWIGRHFRTRPAGDSFPGLCDIAFTAPRTRGSRLDVFGILPAVVAVRVASELDAFGDRAAIQPCNCSRPDCPGERLTREFAKVCIGILQRLRLEAK
jgi:hypothetical protein